MILTLEVLQGQKTKEKTTQKSPRRVRSLIEELRQKVFLQTSAVEPDPKQPKAPSDLRAASQTTFTADFSRFVEHEKRSHRSNPQMMRAE